MRTLVIGGTGTVGSQVVDGLLEKKDTVRVLTRDDRKARTLPAGAEAAIGDLMRPASLRDAMRGMDAVFMVTAVSLTETEEGLNAVRAAGDAGVRRFVYISVYKAAETAHIPHCASKLPVEKALRESGMEWTILQPNHFYQNDLWARDAILSGIYPHPIGEVGLNRVDVRDIATGAVNALTQSGHERRSYPVVGPEALTGNATAAIYSRALGRDVRYAGDDLDAWTAQQRHSMEEWRVEDLRSMYKFIQEHGLIAGPEELQQVSRLLGREPRRFEAFVAETVPAWKGRTATS